MIYDDAILINEKETGYSLSLMSITTIIYKSPILCLGKNGRKYSKTLASGSFLQGASLHMVIWVFLILFLKYFFHFSLKSVTFKMGKKGGRYICTHCGSCVWFYLCTHPSVISKPAPRAIHIYVTLTGLQSDNHHIV